MSYDHLQYHLTLQQRTQKHDNPPPCMWYWKRSVLGLVGSGNETTPLPLPSLRTRPFAVRRKGLGMCPHSNCPYRMQLCMVISDLWQHHAHVRCQSACCSPQLSSNTRVKHRTAQRFAVSSRWRHGKPEEKPFPWHNLQSMILIGQVNIPSWGQLRCMRVPRPLWRVWFRDYF